MRLFTSLLLVMLGLSSPAFSAGFDGASASLLWVIPFAGILLSIAIFPLVAVNIWHHHFGKITALWCLGFIIPFLFSFGFVDLSHVVAHAILLEYIPFMILIFALFTVSGGIYLEGSLKGTPKLNVIILLIGTFLASFMGTTGAAMLLIRPLLRANENRKHRVHIVIFFIFLVANIGGSLTPLGDPPLFLGFLKGVDFLWTMKHMFMPLLITSAIVLGVFFVIDSYYYKKEGNIADVVTEKVPFSIQGKFNFLFLAGMVVGVLISGFWKPNIEFTILGTPIELQNIFRDAVLLILALISLKLTPKIIHEKNEFGWDPVLEVAKLFAGIFITIAPVLAILKAGADGSMSGIVNMVHDTNGAPIDSMYFWMTGALSAFLDNAPTYLVFFNLASGDAQHLMTDLSPTLLAISMGSVFMGAVTYIGNAPNFMVKSIATQAGVNMPTFFGYMKWSVLVLIPVYILLTVIFFI
ncbi:sodium:proton antiporter [Wohlfahrtiimonas larvae]|uniref:Sodium:proton antiporter n=1 Tax=Wohlfahrtiimonas larvae TaxID=1157986 RepID=A0ABP9MP66_9GAMM|nr:sodium:proton antiporter [Wohlfahrtiimonas larvae]